MLKTVADNWVQALLRYLSLQRTSAGARAKPSRAFSALDELGLLTPASSWLWLAFSPD